MIQRQVQPQLQLNDDRVFISAHGNQISSAHLALHGIALGLQIGLHMRIKISFALHVT